MGDPAWYAAAFAGNRERLIAGEVNPQMLSVAFLTVRSAWTMPAGWGAAF
jgi:hypothetical protein